MSKRPSKPRRSTLAPVSLGGTAQESLPFPFVHYPNHYGTFFTFSETEESDPVLCACASSPVANLLRLKGTNPPQRNVNPLRMAQLDSWFFPDAIASASLAEGLAFVDKLRYADGLCHRCNLISPSWRYCHEMYGTKFIQQFGWYVNQTWLRLGVLPNSHVFLADVCPADLQKLLMDSARGRTAFQTEQQRLIEIAGGPARLDIPPDQPTYWRNVTDEDAITMVHLRRESAHSSRTFTKTVEDIVRQEFGFRKVGEGWISETLLFQLVTRVLPGHEVFRHSRPDWLEGLELDMYVPSLSLAFEYQGQQHFHPIKAWGGEAALDALRDRDAKKAKRCRDQGVALVAFHYTEPLTEDHVRSLLPSRTAGGSRTPSGSA